MLYTAVVVDDASIGPYKQVTNSRYLSGSLCEGAPAKRVGERPYLAAFYENVSHSVSFADSAPPLALRATSPVSGESVSQREPLKWQLFLTCV